MFSRGFRLTFALTAAALVVFLVLATLALLHAPAEAVAGKPCGVGAQRTHCSAAKPAADLDSGGPVRPSRAGRGRSS